MNPGGPAAKPLRHIALFGGSFDPVHRMHLALAEQALKQLPIDELWWVPVGQAWQKARALAPAAHRVSMLERAVQALAGGERQRIETCEIERRGPSYTLDTVQTLQQRHPDTRWTLVIGGDQLCGLPTWHRWQELLDRVDLAVAERPGALLQWPYPQPPQGRQWQALKIAAAPVSSTDIRSRAARGEPIDTLVPPGVARYIEHHGLYRQPQGAAAG